MQGEKGVQVGVTPVKVKAGGGGCGEISLSLPRQVPQIHSHWLGLVRKISPSPEPFAEGVSCPSALSQITEAPTKAELGGMGKISHHTPRETDCRG